MVNINDKQTKRHEKYDIMEKRKKKGKNMEKTKNKKEKIWYRININLIAIIQIGTIITALFFYIPSHLATYLVSIILVILPQVLRKTKINLSEQDKGIYYIFLFIAYFLGSVVNLYNTVWYYDILMHLISGLVIGYYAEWILKRNNQDKNNFFPVIFCLSFAIAIAGIWEIAEFSIDKITNSNLQHNLETGVVDTMEDMICGSLGAIIYLILKNQQTKRKERKNDSKY